MTSEPSGELQDKLRALTARLARLEQAVAQHGIQLAPEPPPSAEAPVAPPTPSAPPPQPATPPPILPFPKSIPIPSFAVGSDAQSDTPSLESRIGSQWFNRLGILALLIGVAWFLKFAFDSRWIGPLGRILIGIAAGAALIAWSERFRSRGFTIFSYSLKAVGSGTLYLSLWAAFSLYSLVPAWVAFAAMLLVTAFNGFVSWLQDAELLALYAIAGGLGTPLLVSTGGNHEAVLFSYLLMFDCAVLLLVALRPWSRLLFAAFTGTVLYITGWWFAFYSSDQAGRTAAFLLCFFILFAFAPRLVRLLPERWQAPSGWDALALVALPLSNAALGFLAFYFLVDGPSFKTLAAWIAVAFAGFYLGMNRLPAGRFLKPTPALLVALHVAIALVFLILAVPLETQGRWLTIGWLVEGAALLWLAACIRYALAQTFGLICLCLGLVALLVIHPGAAPTPFLNQRFATYAVAIAVFAAVAFIAVRAENPPELDRTPRWQSIAAASLMVINALVLIAVSSEIHSFWHGRNLNASASLIRDNHIYAQFTYSAFFMLFGAALLAIGFWRRSAFVRWQALVLLALSVGKVFLFDVSELSRGFRILSFIGLGALLLAVSYVYQRDWLNLRRHGDPTP